jgi:hypothetical protein
MNVHGQWPNVEKLLVAWLKLKTGLVVYTETPSNLDSVVPCLQVDRFPGGANREFEKTFTVDVTVWAANRALVWAAVQTVEPAMLQLNSNGSGGFIDEVAELNSFGNVDYSDLNVRRAVGTYSLTARPQ